MNRINPSYIVLLLAIVLGVVLYQNHKIQSLIAQKEKRVAYLEDVAKEIATLRNYWGDKKLQKRRVLEIVNTSFVKRFLKDQQKSADRYKIRLEDIDAPNADRIADKIFNSFVKIGSFSMKKKEKTKLSMEVEFRF